MSKLNSVVSKTSWSGLKVIFVPRFLVLPVSFRGAVGLPRSYRCSKTWPSYKVKAGDEETEYVNTGELVRSILEIGKKGSSLQRYKGLGEMNPDQLWETTMNPETRSLLQVKLEDVAGVEDIFSVLMGDEVGPRRDFIQQHALEVRNLDV